MPSEATCKCGGLQSDHSRCDTRDQGGSVPGSRRRTRRRSPDPASALADIGTFQRPRDRLNEVTPHVTRCAWPGCRDPLRYNIGTGPKERRYGVLCETHAVDIAVAVIQEQKARNLTEKFFEKQTTEQAVRWSEWRAEDERNEAAKAALRQDRDGFVYYLMVGERLKIGYSVDVKQRMRHYPPGSELLAVEPGDRQLETQRHQQFAGSRTDGREWFRPTPDLLELVDEIVSVHGEPKRFAHHYRRKQEPVRIRRAS